MACGSWPSSEVLFANGLIKGIFFRLGFGLEIGCHYVLIIKTLLSAGGISVLSPELVLPNLTDSVAVTATLPAGTRLAFVLNTAAPITSAVGPVLKIPTQVWFQFGYLGAPPQPLARGGFA